uniref:Uncharacterized protein n=1 Tax=Triticum urartu TaxID=4572 RepID=A0A8R7V3K7_TRIUA
MISIVCTKNWRFECTSLWKSAWPLWWIGSTISLLCLLVVLLYHYCHHQHHQLLYFFTEGVILNLSELFCRAG